jgi:regulator of protease activity HflC (stomatin/prohibitin superfamily)
MNQALSFISDIWEFITSLFPHLEIVPATHSGVKFVRGKNIVEVSAGMVWYWPIVTELETVPIVRQVAKLDTQTLTTKDGFSVIVGGLIVYYVDDPIVFLTENDDADTSVDDACLTAIRDVVQTSTWDELRSTYRAVVDKKLTKEAGESLDIFGVTVERARLTELAKTKVISLVGAFNDG